MLSSIGASIVGLPAELLYHIFGFLEDRYILTLGKTCRVLNQYAIPVFLRRKGTHDAEQDPVVVQPYHNSHDDELTGLILHFTMAKMKHLTCKLDRRPDWEIEEDFRLVALSRSPMEGLTQNLRRLLQLVGRLDEVGSLHLHFYSLGAAWVLSSDDLQEFLATLLQLINLAISKSCSDILLSHPHPLTDLRPPYKFQLISGGNMVLQDFVRRSLSIMRQNSNGENDCGLQGDGWRFQQMFKYKCKGIVTPPPRVIQLSKLTTLDMSSDFLLLPPFSSWTFNILKHAPITRLSLTILRIISSEELHHYVLPQILGRVPQLTELRIGFHREELYSIFLDYITCLPQLQKLTFAWATYGHLPPRKPSPLITLSHLTSFTGSPYQAAYFFGGPISCPSIRYINIVADRHRGRLRCVDLADQFAIINQGVCNMDPAPIISLCVAYVFLHGSSTAPLLPDHDTRHLATISRLTLTLPYSSDNQQWSQVVDYVFECLEIFSNLSALTLISRSCFEQQDALIGMIKGDYPNIVTLNIIGRRDYLNHCHWSNMRVEPGFLTPNVLESSDCVCSHF
ncbi:hypothetical protein D9619_013174 [Psilocybe cf. subviscida]|uniref:F-box domain-containing protein n=1 Tax=Psilocybe cf. subviscida TaxID=2480587 RepID=A0A8H5EYQ4_9AGAR|nr:hypothetical protein D9619_013174 [Psilocybe cf. subviscida]